MEGKNVVHAQPKTRSLTLEELQAIQCCRQWMNDEPTKVMILNGLLEELRDSTCDFGTVADMQSALVC